MRTFAPKGNVYGPIMPMYVFKRKISPGAKIMYGYLCNLAGCNDHCWPLNKTIADSIGTCETSVKNYMRELTNDNLIQIRFVNNKRQIYFLIPEDIDCGINIKITLGTGNVRYDSCNTSSNHGNTTYNAHNNFSNHKHCSGSDVNNMQYISQRQTNIVHHQAEINPGQPNIVHDQANIDPINNLKNKNKEIKNTPTHPSNVSQPMAYRQKTAQGTAEPPSAGSVRVSFTPDFENIWEAYPKKMAKGEAYDAWQSLLRKNALPPVNDLKEAIGRMRQSKSWQKEDGRFVPLLAKWLRTMGWFDQLSEAERAEQAQEEKNRQRLAAEKERDREVNEKRQQWFDSIRPEFEAFAARFSGIRNRREAFGLWSGLRDKGVAPTAKDVPDGENRDITHFLLDFRNRMNSQFEAPKLDNGMPQKDYRTMNNCNAILAMLRGAAAS